jgi:indolepyruvate ferredoxin oxidoreductase
MLDATKLAEALLGDAIYANVLMLGAAWQAGLVPLSEAAILRAIEINGASVDGNKHAFAIGRWAVARPAEAAAALHPPKPAATDLAGIVEARAAHLVAYQGKALARRYRALVERAAAADPELGLAVAKGYHKLLAYKDEYEVARLHAASLDRLVAERFEGVREVRFHLAPPIFGKKDTAGNPVKSEFGPWMMRAFRLLAKFKALRGTALDPFGRTEERRMERRLIADYEADLERLLAGLAPETQAIAVARAALPLEIRGFGHVKAKAAEAAEARRAELMAAFAAGGTPRRHAAE